VGAGTRIVRFGPFEVDLGLEQLRRLGQEVAIQELPFRLLALLLERPGELVRRSEIQARLWPEGVFVDFEHGLNTAVKKLRRALGDSPARPRYIETLPRRGYRFLGRLVDESASPAEDLASDAAAVLVRAPFVGRREELAFLEARSAAARAGHGACVVVSGEAGIGKTRLLEEHAERARSQGLRVLWGRFLEGEGAPPHAAFAEALGEYARSTDLETLRSVLGVHAPVLAKLVPAVRERLAALPEPASLEPEDDRTRVADAVVESLRAVASREPVLLVLEDLHWAGGTSLAILPRIAAIVPQSRLLVVASLRGAEPEGALARDALARLPLGPRCGTLELRELARERVGELLEALAGHPVGPDFVELLHRGTGGNPLLLHQILLHMVEAGQLGRTRGAWAPELELDQLDVPATVRDVVGRRLARLSEDTRRLLAVGCVSSSTFDFEAAWRAAGLEEDFALDALDEALEAQLVREADEPQRYEFCHALVRQVIYGSLSASRRTRTHRRYAEGLVRFAPGRVPPSAEVAEHYWRSAELHGAEAGLPYCVAAADAAERSAAYGDSARFLRMGLALVPAGSAPRLEARLGLALAWSGDREHASRVAARAGELLAASEGPAAAAAYLADAADAVWWGLFDRRAWSLGEQGLGYAERRDLVWARLMAHALSGREAEDPRYPGVPRDSDARRELSDVIFAHPEALELQEHNELWRHVVFESRKDVLQRGAGIGHFLGYWAGEYREAVAYTRAGVEVALARHQRLRAGLLLGLLSRLELALGDVAACEASLARANELAPPLESSPLVGVWLGAVGAEIAVVRGEGFEALLPSYQAALSLDVPEIRWVLPVTRVGSAFAHAMLGRADEAVALVDGIRGALEVAPAHSAMYPLVLHLAVQALWVAQRAEGLPLLERCLREKLLPPDFRHPHSDARLSLARVAALAGRYDEAEQWFARAREVLDEQGARPLRALCDLDEALALLTRGGGGARVRAHALLDAATARFEEVGMPGWIRHADALRRRS
jgi:DNA-binding winged helix-turn-helix (wHTH) protein/tetratricopeptide (TPR) repeat protein